MIEWIESWFVLITCYLYIPVMCQLIWNVIIRFDIDVKVKIECLPECWHIEDLLFERNHQSINSSFLTYCEWHHWYEGIKVHCLVALTISFSNPNLKSINLKCTNNQIKGLTIYLLVVSEIWESVQDCHFPSIPLWWLEYLEWTLHLESHFHAKQK